MRPSPWCLVNAPIWRRDAPGTIVQAAAGAGGWRAHATGTPQFPGDWVVTDSSPIVFVVDDDPSIRDALTSLIRLVGLRIEAFGSA